MLERSWTSKWSIQLLIYVGQTDNDACLETEGVKFFAAYVRVTPVYECHLNKDLETLCFLPFYLNVWIPDCDLSCSNAPTRLTLSLPESIIDYGDVKKF